MKVLVCGSRTYADKDHLFAVLDKIHKKWPITAIGQGGAKGADSLAHQWAVENHIKKIDTYFADWDTHGPSAGPIRNRWMLKDFEPDLVVAFPGGYGTEHMISIAMQKEVIVCRA